MTDVTEAQLAAAWNPTEPALVGQDWQPPAPWVAPPILDATERTGPFYWHGLTPLEALVMLAAMIDQSADVHSPKADRHTSYLGIAGVIRRQLDTARRWTGEDIGDALAALVARGALAVRPGRVTVRAWPIPGGAPW